MTDLVDTTEMYLRTVLDLEEESIVPLRARISERLGHSGPTVSQTVARMERDGLLMVSGDRHLELSPEGRQRAVEVMRKHRLAERLLSDVIGLEWEYVHVEACRWEHVMSQEVEHRILALLDQPAESPYGTPIPRLEDTGQDLSEAFLRGMVSAVTAAAGGGDVRVTVRRLAEPVQFDPDLLGELKRAGVVPSASGTVSVDGDGVVFRIDGAADEIRLTNELAMHVFVAVETDAAP